MVWMTIGLSNRVGSVYFSVVVLSWQCLVGEQLFLIFFNIPGVLLPIQGRIKVLLKIINFPIVLAIGGIIVVILIVVWESCVRFRWGILHSLSARLRNEHFVGVPMISRCSCNLFCWNSTMKLVN